MYLPCRWICLGIELALLFILPISEDLVSLIPRGGKELFIHFLSFFFNWRLQQGDCLTVLNLFSELIIVFHPLYYNYSLLGWGREKQADVFTCEVLWCCFSPSKPSKHFCTPMSALFWCGCINEGRSSRSHVRTQCCHSIRRSWCDPKSCIAAGSALPQHSQLEHGPVLHS